MTGAGVTQEDGAIVRAVLESLSTAICNDKDSCKNSICDRYSRALNYTNKQLVTAVVSGTFNAAIDPNSGIRVFFNGSARGSSDFEHNDVIRSKLVDDLVAFFGAALGCTDKTVAAYTGNPSMKEVHQDLPINLNAFNIFNGALLGVLKGAGVSEPDRNAVNGILQSLKGDICNQPDCVGASPTPPGPTNGPAPPPSNIGTTFVFNVVPKSKHPFTGMGFGSGFQVDGLEGRPLNLIAGKVYTFQNDALCAHPLYVTDSDTGAGTPDVTDGITYPGGDGTRVCKGGQLTFTPTDKQIGKQYYYQCRNHEKMGYTINIFKNAASLPVTTGSGTITLEAVSGGSTTAKAGTATTPAPAATGATPDAGSASAFVPSIVALFALIALLI